MHKGKFSSDRDAMLYEMAVCGWANFTSGDFGAPSGWFALVKNHPEEMNEIIEAFPEASPVREDLTGYFIVEENGDGFVNVVGFDYQWEADDEFSLLLRQYYNWLEGGR